MFFTQVFYGVAGNQGYGAFLSLRFKKGVST